MGKIHESWWIVSKDDGNNSSHAPLQCDVAPSTDSWSLSPLPLHLGWCGSCWVNPGPLRSRSQGNTKHARIILGEAPV